MKTKKKASKKFHLTYVDEGTPRLVSFKTKTERDKFIKEINIDLDSGTWIDLIFTGTLDQVFYDVDYAKK